MNDQPKRPALTIAQLESINAASANGQQRISDELRKLAILATDANAEQRREKRECQHCTYAGRYRLAGQAFTEWSCQVCSEPQEMHPNTAVPRICAGCSAAYGLCVTCGGDLDMKHRGRITGRKAKRG